MELKYFSKEHHNWDYNLQGPWVGGHLAIQNLSRGYHGLMKQWWEKYATGNQVLLLSEGADAKADFVKHYPHWQLKTLDLYPEIANDHACDLVGDIAHHQNPLKENSFDLIINQATLEHVYNPYQAMLNMCAALSDGGILVSHTHPPGFAYHSYPRDYFRFMVDWWIDLPNWADSVELLELFEGYHHVFTCYRKTT